MESLDDFLESLHVDLESDEREDEVKRSSEATEETHRRLETFTDSILRDDVVAPHIVHFTTYTTSRSRKRKVAIIFLVLALSVSSLFRFSKLILPLFHEGSSVIVDKEVDSNDSRPSGNN